MLFNLNYRMKKRFRAVNPIWNPSLGRRQCYFGLEVFLVYFLLSEMGLASWHVVGFLKRKSEKENESKYIIAHFSWSVIQRSRMDSGGPIWRRVCTRLPKDLGSYPSGKEGGGLGGGEMEIPQTVSLAENSNLL